MKKIVAICENKECVNALTKACADRGLNLDTEIQKEGVIISEVSEETIKNADAVLFVLNSSIEEVEGIERFIDCEYYEVDTNTVINNTDEVLKEIEADIQ